MTASSHIETITVAGDHISVDLLIWRRFKKYNEDLCERVLDFNPGLADLGPILPIGTVVNIPLDAPELQPVERDVVSLWD